MGDPEEKLHMQTYFVAHGFLQARE